MTTETKNFTAVSIFRGLFALLAVLSFGAGACSSDNGGSPASGGSKAAGGAAHAGTSNTSSGGTSSGAGSAGAPSVTAGQPGLGGGGSGSGGAGGVSAVGGSGPATGGASAGTGGKASSGGAGGGGTAAGGAGTGGAGVAGGGGTIPLKNPPVLSAGCGKATTVTSGKKTITSTNQQRTYIIDIPANYDMNKPYRLFYTSHWIGSTSEAVRDQNYYFLKPLATAANEPAIFVAPQSDGQTWQQKDH